MSLEGEMAYCSATWMEVLLIAYTHTHMQLKYINERINQYTNIHIYKIDI